MHFASIAALAVAFLFVGKASAEEPKFFLNPDGSVEQRLAGVESKTVALERRIAELEKKLAVPKTILNNAGATFEPPPKVAKVRFQTCVKGRCTQGECDDLSQVPFGATILSGVAGVASPCPTGPCGDACGCASSSFGATASTTSSGRRRLFSGRVRGALGSCASCGQ